MDHKLACSAMSLTKGGETASQTTNCTVTFQLCQTQTPSQGPLLSIPAEQERGCKGPYEGGCVRQRIELNLEGFFLLATVIASKLVLWRPAPGHLRRGRLNRRMKWGDGEEESQVQDHGQVI